MLEYGRIDVSEGINTNKTTNWCECIIISLLVLFQAKF